MNHRPDQPDPAASAPPTVPRVSLASSPASQLEDLKVLCPQCGTPMEFTGLPDLSGPVHFRFYRCPSHGVMRVDFDEDKEGWG